MRKGTLIGFSISLSIAVLAAGVEISAQDKYSVKVPNGLAFSEFKGYEGWSLIAISENGGKIAAILGNPAMIDAYKQGVPGNGKAFPDGARMAKIHWNPKKQETYPGQPTVPGTQHDVDFMVKDSKRFADSGGWGWGAFEYDAASAHADATLREQGAFILEQLHTAGTFSPSALLFASCLREISADWQNRSARRLKKCAASRGRSGFARIETAS
jgi:hypothetical protein